MIILFGFPLFLQFLHFSQVDVFELCSLPLFYSSGNNRQKKVVLVCSLGHNYQNLCAIKFGFCLKYFNLMFSVLYPFFIFLIPIENGWVLLFRRQQFYFLFRFFQDQPLILPFRFYFYYYFDFGAGALLFESFANLESQIILPTKIYGALSWAHIISSSNLILFLFGVLWVNFLDSLQFQIVKRLAHSAQTHFHQYCSVLYTCIKSSNAIR